LIPEKYTPFWNFVKLTIGGCKLVLNHVLTLWIWLFVLYKCLFFITNIDREKIYCEYTK